MNNMKKIDKKYTIPKIVILDDMTYQVTQTLQPNLEKLGFKVKVFESKETFTKYLEDHIVQFLLIDVSLSERDTNIEGLRIAKECAEKFGEASRMCISRKTIRDVSNEEIIQSINPIPNKNFERYVEAYGNKHNSIEICDLVVHLRSKIINNDNVEILVDDSIVELITSDFKFLDQRNGTSEPSRQFFELIKRLSSKPYDSTIEKVHLSRIGTGRSRTVICSMNVFMVEDNIPYTSIIKIGYLQPITQEVQNYRKNVPKLFRHGHFPILDSYSLCRDYAGLSYGKLGDFKENVVPPTLRDKIIKKEINIEKDAKKIVEGIFGSIIHKDSIKSPMEIKTLWEEYTDRYHTLDKTDVLFKLAEQSLFKLIELGIGRFNKPKNNLFMLNKFGNIKLRKLEELFNLNVGFSPYKEKICHGDLHFDNIILDPNIVQYYFIDFAHTKEHHCFIDHIVLELGVRFQLMSDYIQSFNDSKDLFENLIKFEIGLNNIAQNNNVSFQIDNNLIPYQKLISTIRHNAKLQFPTETTCNYFGGLGLTLASAIRLPVSEKIKEHLRVWFSFTSMLSLELFESNVDKCLLNFSNYGKEISATQEDDILTQLDLFRDSIIYEVKSFMNSLIESNKISEYTYINTIQKQQFEIMNVLDELGNEFPILKKEIDNINKTINQQISDPQYTGGISFGFPFFMFQLNRKVDLPEPYKQRILKISKIPFKRKIK